MEITGTVSSLLESKGRVVHAVAPDVTVFEAIRQLAEKNIGALLVMEEGRLAGLFSERDYTRKVALLGRNSRETRVREVISGQVITVTGSATVHECLRLMTERRVRHLPVLQDGQVAGVVSIGDLVNWVISAQRATINQLENYIAGGYAG